MNCPQRQPEHIKRYIQAPWCRTDPGRWGSGGDEMVHLVLVQLGGHGLGMGRYQQAAADLCRPRWSVGRSGGGPVGGAWQEGQADHGDAQDQVQPVIGGVQRYEVGR